MLFTNSDGFHDIESLLGMLLSFLVSQVVPDKRDSIRWVATLGCCSQRHLQDASYGSMSTILLACGYSSGPTQTVAWFRLHLITWPGKLARAMLVKQIELNVITS